MVGITRGKPKFKLMYELAGNIIEFAPPGYLFSEFDRVKFTPPYFRHMDKLGVTKARGLIRPYLSPDKDLVLCCFEDVRKPNEWCHRLVFAEWWQSRTGEVIEELPDPSPWWKTKKEEKLKAAEVDDEEKDEKPAEDDQLRMW